MHGIVPRVGTSWRLLGDPGGALASSAGNSFSKGKALDQQERSDRMDPRDGPVPASTVGRRPLDRRLGVSKNAMVGKAHRLDLPSRPSPIRREGGSTARTPHRPSVSRLADIVPLETAVVVPARHLPETCGFPLRPASVPAKSVAHAPTTRAPSSPGAVGNNPCYWLIGERGKGGFRFCDSSALVGKPYCGEHAQLAYRRVRRCDDDGRMAAAE